MKNMLRKMTIVSITAILSSCGVAPQKIPQYTVGVPFDSVAAKEMLRPGNNTIKGSALIRQAGGGVVTCAGQDVRLIPATAYSIERFRMIYDYTDGGYYPASKGNFSFVDDHPEYATLTRSTTCDAQGFFKFEGVADGDFFVTTKVAWMVQSIQGGLLARRVVVKGNETKEIVLSTNPR